MSILDRQLWGREALRYGKRKISPRFKRRTCNASIQTFIKTDKPGEFDHD